MNTAVRAMFVVPFAGAAALALLIAGPALAGHRIESWVSTPPRNLAFVTGFHCNAAAKRERDFGTPIPPEY
jgi:hypothetical protein